MTGLTAISYSADGLALTGWLADGSRGAAAPGVLVAHEGSGLTEHSKDVARRLAGAGYVSLALDMSGETATSVEHGTRLFQGLMADAGAIRRRAGAALDLLAARSNVDATRLAVLGFCFGGIVALEMARDAAPIRCAIACRPSFKKAAGSSGAPQVPVLMIAGDADPILPEEDRRAFEAEMRASGVDWRLHLLGGVGHSFTNPAVDRLGFPGFNYDARADARSWRLVLDALAEAFAQS